MCLNKPRGFPSSPRCWAAFGLLIVLLFTFGTGVVAQAGRGGEATVRITNICEREVLRLSALVLYGEGFKEVKQLSQVGLKPNQSKTFDFDVPAEPEALLVEGMVGERRFHTRISPLRLGSSQVDKEYCLGVVVNFNQQASEDVFVQLTNRLPDGRTQVLLKRSISRERLGLLETPAASLDLYLCTDKGCLEKGTKAVYKPGDRVKISFGSAPAKFVRAGCRYIAEHQNELSTRPISLGGTVERPTGQRTLFLTIWQDKEAASKGERSIARVRCSYAVEEEVRCECGEWPDRDGSGTADITVEGNTVNDGEVLTVPQGELPITLSPGYRCHGKCQQITYKWYVYGPAGSSSSGRNVSAPFNLTQSELGDPGSYTVTLVPGCGGSDCSEFQFRLRFEEDVKRKLLVGKLAFEEGGETLGSLVTKEVGQDVKFRVDIINGGNRPLSDIVVSDSLTEGLEYVEGSSNYPIQSSSPNLIWQISGPIEPGDFIALIFSAHVVSPGRHENCVKARTSVDGYTLTGENCAYVNGAGGGGRCGDWGEVNVGYYSSASEAPSTWSGECGETIELTTHQTPP